MGRVATPSLKAFEQITITGGTAKGLTASEISGMSYAFISLEGAPIRWRGDGTAPTAEIGHRFEVGEKDEFTGAVLLANFQFIPVDPATTAILNCSYGI